MCLSYVAWGGLQVTAMLTALNVCVVGLLIHGYVLGKLITARCALDAVAAMDPVDIALSHAIRYTCEAPMRGRLLRIADM